MPWRRRTSGLVWRRASPRTSGVLAAWLLVACGLPAAAQESFGVGRAATPDELREADTTIGPEGEELPPGSGSAVQGAAVFATRGCGRCHGPTLVEGPGPKLVGDDLTGLSYYPVSYWPYAPLIFDYVRRAMPYDRAGTLSDDEVYALTALLLFRNGIIEEQDVMDAGSLPRVVMPNADRYAPPPADWQPGRPRPWTAP